MSKQQFMQRDIIELEASDDCETIEIKAVIVDDNQNDIFANFSFSIDEFLTA